MRGTVWWDRTQDLEFCKRFVEAVGTKWPRVMDTRRVGGPLAVLEAKLAARHAVQTEQHQLA